LLHHRRGPREIDLHLDASIEMTEPERRVVLSTALEYGATAHDAVFIALAVANQTPLITAERTTAEWMRRLAALIEPIR
jgi:hypothetical protein